MQTTSVEQPQPTGKAWKTFVVKLPGGDRTPFLRGILVQSLVSSGLSFDDAYGVAQTIRESLREVDEISSHDLKALVGDLIELRFDEEAREIYANSPDRDQQIIVTTRSRKGPFSVGILARSLEACAIDSQLAWAGARNVHEHLQEIGCTEIDHRALRQVIHDSLLVGCPQGVSDRYLSWRQFENSGVPLILLIGGATGTGKSSVTAQIAYRLDVVRTQSTDMMREIIRCYLAPHVVPTLGYSSFEAWRGLPAPHQEGNRATDNPVIAGYLAQFSAVRVALEATIARATEERHHLVVDGVHVLPTQLDLGDASEKAIVVPIMLATLRKNQLELQLARRAREQPERGSSRHLEHIDDIWELQAYLLSEADRESITIIPNWTINQTAREVLNLISATVMERYPPDPEALS
jgi:2-phosphoglycerate kinase